MAATDPIVLVVDDFMVRARVRDVAKSVGVLVVACDALHARARVRELRARGVLLDLSLKSASAIQVIEDLRGDPALTALPLLAFVSHLDVDLAETARRAGATEVLPRSRFHRQLVEILLSLGA